MTNTHQTLTVDLGDRSYPIYIGSGLLQQSQLLAPHISGKQIVVVTNTTVAALYLDTLMAGYFHYDFGDAVRTVVSESKEDEQVITNINFNLTLFEEFVKGMFTHNFNLTEKEIKLLPISCALMPFMHGLRALTDYLNGNIYYKVSYKNQNLDRCISLFEFTKKALKYQDDITYIIEKQLIQNNF